MEEPHHIQPVSAEASEIELEVIDDGRGQSVSGVEPTSLPPSALIEAFRSMLKARMLTWLRRTVMWGFILGFLANEYKLMRVVFFLWASFSLLLLVFYIVGWYAAGRQIAVLDRLLKPSMRKIETAETGDR